MKFVPRLALKLNIVFPSLHSRDRNASFPDLQTWRNSITEAMTKAASVLALVGVFISNKSECRYLKLKQLCVPVRSAPAPVKSYLSYLPNCCFLLDNRHPIKDIFLKHGFHPLQTDLFCCLKVNVMDSVSNFEEYWDNFLPNQFLQTQFLAFIWWYFQHEVTILL